MVSLENDNQKDAVNAIGDKVYKEWDTQDVSSWLKDSLKLPQYCETFCKLIFILRTPYLARSAILHKLCDSLI